MPEVKQLIQQQREVFDDQELIADGVFVIPVKASIRLNFKKVVDGDMPPISIYLKLERRHQLELVRAAAHMNCLPNDEKFLGDNADCDTEFSLPEQGLTFGFPY